MYSVVTGLFDIGRDKFSNWDRKWETYCQWFKNCLSLDCNMIIYVEEKTKDFVIESRKIIDPNLSKTKIIIKNISDLSFYKYTQRMNEVMMSSDFRSNLTDGTVPEVNYPLYNVVTYSKINLVRESAEHNPFNSKYFFWLDAGCMHSKFPENYRYKLFPDPSKVNFIDQNKIYITCRSQPQLHDLNLKVFLKSHINRFAAFIIGMNKENAIFLENFLHEFMNEMLDQNLIDCEQSSIAICYLRNKNKFQLCHGDWFDGFKKLI